MTEGDAQRRSSDAPVAWVASGIVVGLVVVAGIGEEHVEAGIGYGALGGALVAWLARRRR